MCMHTDISKAIEIKHRLFRRTILHKQAKNVKIDDDNDLDINLSIT